MNFRDIKTSVTASAGTLVIVADTLLSGVGMGSNIKSSLQDIEPQTKIEQPAPEEIENRLKGLNKLIDITSNPIKEIVKAKVKRDKSVKAAKLANAPPYFDRPPPDQKEPTVYIENSCKKVHEFLKDEYTVESDKNSDLNILGKPKIVRERVHGQNKESNILGKPKIMLNTEQERGQSNELNILGKRKIRLATERERTSPIYER